MIELSALSKWFEKEKAVGDFSLTVASGEIVSLLGESGSGKTTLLKMAAGLLAPDSGQILLQGQPLGDPADQLIAGHPEVALLRQDSGLFPNVSIRQNVAYALRFARKDLAKEKTDHLLDLCRLIGVQHRLPREVSGGEKQRTALAQALAAEPKVLLLDEPFSHADVLNRQIGQQAIREVVHSEGLACLYVTHDAPDALAVGHRTGVMQQGKLLQLDRPEELYRYPHNSYIAYLTGTASILTTHLVAGHLLPPGTSINALCCVRPEDVRITDTTASGLTGIVKSVLFKGPHYEVEVSLKGNALLWMLCSHNPPLAGQPVVLQLERVQVLP